VLLLMNMTVCISSLHGFLLMLYFFANYPPKYILNGIGEKDITYREVMVADTSTVLGIRLGVAQFVDTVTGGDSRGRYQVERKAGRRVNIVIRFLFITSLDCMGRRSFLEMNVIFPFVDLSVESWFRKFPAKLQLEFPTLYCEIDRGPFEPRYPTSCHQPLSLSRSSRKLNRTTANQVNKEWWVKSVAG